MIKELRNYYEGVGFDSFINSDIDLMFQLNDLTSAPTRFEEMCDKIKSNCGSRSEFDFHLSKNTVTISATYEIFSIPFLCYSHYFFIIFSLFLYIFYFSARKQSMVPMYFPYL